MDTRWRYLLISKGRGIEVFRFCEESEKQKQSAAMDRAEWLNRSLFEFTIEEPSLDHLTKLGENQTSFSC